MCSSASSVYVTVIEERRFCLTAAVANSFWFVTVYVPFCALTAPKDRKPKAMAARFLMMWCFMLDVFLVVQNCIVRPHSSSQRCIATDVTLRGIIVVGDTGVTL